MPYSDDPISTDDLLKEEETQANVDITDESGEMGAGGSTTSLDSDDDVEKVIEDITGANVIPGKPFSLADEIEKNELNRRGIDPTDLESDE